MIKTILIYASCVNPTANGDFSFAGNIARDLVREIKQKQLGIDVVLVSTLDEIGRFEKIYGQAINGRITIENENIGLSSLEQFDAVENTVIAYIEANRCKYAPAEIVKRILSPDCKFLFIGNVNHSDKSDPLIQIAYRERIKEKQPGLYEAFDSADIMIGEAGINDTRLGLPYIQKTANLPDVPTHQQTLLAKGNYGFMYVANTLESRNYRLITQYIKLNHLDHYVLVGNFEHYQFEIQTAYENSFKYFMNAKDTLPLITYHQSLPHIVMRKVVADSTDSLVLSTGVFSTLEAMQDGKLVYYQDFDENAAFVSAYLIAIKSIASSDTSLFGNMPQLMIELSGLLFASKPLSSMDMKRTHNLLSMPSLNVHLIEANQKIIEQANGKLAPRLLTFITGANNTQRNQQLISICKSLRKSLEIDYPEPDQALRRAAAWGRLFELKVLINETPRDQLNIQDTIYHRTAVHWAVKKEKTDCLRYLIQSEASLDIRDKEGKTPLHFAVDNKDKAAIKLLIENGALTDIPDKRQKTPKDYADAEMLMFIQNCQMDKSYQYYRSKL